MSHDIIPLEALFSDWIGPQSGMPRDPRDMLSDADLVVGVDVMSRREFVVYGREVLQQIIDKDQPQTLLVMRVGLDEDADDLQRLLALVQSVKGKHDYRPAADDSEPEVGGGET